MNTLPLRGSLGVLANGGVVSPGCRSRHSSTRCTPMLSSAQPVTATDPASAVVPPAGVSSVPKGGEAGAVFEVTVNVTPIDAALLLAPVNVNWRLPVCEEVSPETNRVEIVSRAGPLPAVGDTTSHGTVAVA